MQMQECTFVDIVFKNSVPEKYLEGCPIQDATFRRNLLTMMKRMSLQEDVVMLHYGLENVAVVYRSECKSNPAVHNAILEGIFNMEKMRRLMTKKKNKKSVLEHHIKYICYNLL